MEAPHNNALLIFRVGPVLCATSSLAVLSIISPPKLTHPPGSNPAHPGIFYHAKHVVSVTDLRYQFGLDESEWTEPGRLIITEADDAYDALWVDDIIEVIETPKEGWGSLPPLLPKKTFSHTLLIDDKIHLYTELRQLVDIEESGVLRQYIENLRQNPAAVDTAAPQEGEQETASRKVTGGKTETPAEARPVSEPTDAPVAPMTGVQEAAAAHDADTSGTAISVGEGEAEPAAPATGPADEASQTEGEAETAEGLHDIEEPASATAEETPKHAEPEPETGGEMPAEEQTDAAAANTDAAPQQDAATPAPAELEQSQDDDSSAMAEPAPAEESEHVAIDPAESKTVIDERFIIEDEPHIPLVLDEDGGDDSVVLATDRDRDRDSPHEGKSRLSLVIIAMAAALLIAGIGGGLFYYFTSPPAAVGAKDEAEISSLATPNSDNESGDNKTQDPVADNPVVAQTKASDAATEKTIEVMEERPSAASPGNGYRADIKEDKEGVTILLHAPKGEPVLREDTAAAAKKTAAKKPTPKAKKNNKKTSKPRGKGEVIHTIVKGDTLWAIAEYYVKDPFRYPELARLSKIKDPDLIYPGNRVRIIDKNGKP